MGNASQKFYIPKSSQEFEKFAQAHRNANVNVCKIDFSILGNSPPISIGDPVFCQRCRVALNF